MNLVRVTLVVLGATAALIASACGGAVDVPSGSIAVVDGSEISKEELDKLLDAAKKGYQATKREFPKAGTPEYQSIQTQYVAYLVQREELRQAAADLGVEVTEQDVDKAENELIKSRGWTRKEYEEALKEQGFTAADYRSTLETSVLYQKLYEEVTKDAKVTDQDVLAYYTQNQSQYGSPESRDVRHILIAKKSSDGKTVDFEASKARAEEIYAELEAGGDFKSLAKTNSDDPGSKDSGGELTITRGQTVPEFDKVSFELKEGEVSKPVKTTYGYHVIEALSPVRPAKATPLAKVRASIRTTLLQSQRNEAMSAWAEDLRKKYEGKVSYAAGYEPPEVPEAPTETQ